MRPDLRLCPGTVAATSIDLVDNIGNQTIVVGIDGSATALAAR